jgi:predicted RNase H-like nuclease
VCVWSGFTWLRIGTVAVSREYGNEPSASGAAELFTYFIVTTNALYLSVSEVLLYAD